MHLLATALASVYCVQEEKAVLVVKGIRCNVAP